MKKYIFISTYLLMAGVLFVGGILLLKKNPPQLNPLIFPFQQLLPTQPPEYTKVVRVVDGDTIEIEDKKKVRYIGINTPETVDPRRKVECFGRESSNKNKELVEGMRIRMEKDISDIDKYNRLLRYVWIEDKNSSLSGVFVNDYLVRQGFAQVSTFPPDVKYVDQFVKAQREARENNRGLWNVCK